LISLIKLVDGTELLGEIVDDTPTTVTVSEPLAVNMSYARPGAFPMITLHRYSFFIGNKEVKFKKEHVLTITDTRPGVDTFYINTLKNQEEIVDKAFETSLSITTSEMMDDLQSNNEMYKSFLEVYKSSTAH